MKKLTSSRDFRQFLMVFFGLAASILLMTLPRPYSIIVMIGSVVIIVWMPLQRTIQLPQIRWRIRNLKWLYAAEIISVMLLLFSVTGRAWQGDDPVSRGEYSYLIGTGAVAGEIYNRTGSIPLWNPLMGSGGEPMLESPFSYVMNPLMFFPVVVGGSIAGSNLAVGFHILLIGIGGWLLGYTLNLKLLGRVLLGVMIPSLGGTTQMIGTGFYQLGLSQAYVPFVYAGLFGTIYRKERWYVGILSVATYLLIAAGTYWYVLPTAISCVVIILFALPLKRDALKRLMLASGFILGTSAVRLVPQAIHNSFIDHPWVTVRESADVFVHLILLYFDKTDFRYYRGSNVHYHYIISFAALSAMLIPRVLVWRGVKFRWRVIVPSLLLILFFLMWAQAGGSIFLWVQAHVPLVAEWRYTSRFLTSGGVWLVVILAICVDDVMQMAQRNIKLIWGLAILVVIVTSVIAVNSALNNWKGWVRPPKLERYSTILIEHLRREHPDGMLAVMSPDFFDYLAFYDTLTRAYFGNPDYRPHGYESTLGDVRWMRGIPSIGFNLANTQWENRIDEAEIEVIYLENHAYEVWNFPDALPYSFTMDVDDAKERGKPDIPLTRAEVTPIESYSHHVDWIEVWLPPQDDEQILVLQETAYPGWEVRVNGEAAQLESFGERVGVILPQDESVYVVFRYNPVWLYVGSIITVIANGALILYLLGFKKRKEAQS